MSITKRWREIRLRESALRKPRAAVERWGWASIGVSGALGVLWLGIAVASGSLAVASEALHNLTDFAASVALLLGLKISQRRSKAFPYGLYKVENVAAVGLAVLIMFTAFEIVQEAFTAQARRSTVNSWTLTGVVLSIVIPLVFSHFELRAGRMANSPSIVAQAVEFRTHMFSSGVVLISLIGHVYGLNLDRPAALIVVFFIAKSGWSLLRDGMRVLLDASLDAQTLARVRQVIEGDPAVVGVRTLTGRSSGRYRFLEAEVTLRTNNLEKAHATSGRIEQAVRGNVPFVERVIVHFEPTPHTHRRDAFPLANPDGRLSEHFGKAPYFLLVTVRLSDGLRESEEVLENPCRELPEGKGIRVAEWLVSQKVDRVILREALEGRGPAYVLSAAGVEMMLTTVETAGEVYVVRLNGTSRAVC